MKAAVYLRVATAEQAMIDSQKRRVLAAVARHPDWEVSEIYTDIGGFKDATERPGWDKLMRDAVMHRFDIVAMSSITRLSRDDQTSQQMLEHLKQDGIQIAFTNDLSREEVRG